MSKVVLFAFQGELMCFVHVLLNALDMEERGMEPLVVFEGAACKLVPELGKESNPFHGLYSKAKGLGLIAGACKACSSKMGVLEDVKSEGVTLLDDMNGHPSVASFMEKGFTVLTF